mmetsp:Transcript_68203/g.192675  ORF Transcript_68203/g.192675 Transcript_68203/m.192675 type:complete len:200 (-) Transcript_68203:399-998(-)
MAACLAAALLLLLVLARDRLLRSLLRGLLILRHGSRRRGRGRGRRRGSRGTCLLRVRPGVLPPPWPGVRRRVGGLILILVLAPPRRDEGAPEPRAGAVGSLIRSSAERGGHHQPGRVGLRDRGQRLRLRPSSGAPARAFGVVPPPRMLLWCRAAGSAGRHARRRMLAAGADPADGRQTDILPWKPLHVSQNLRFQGDQL